MNRKNSVIVFDTSDIRRAFPESNPHLDPDRFLRIITNTDLVFGKYDELFEKGTFIGFWFDYHQAWKDVHSYFEFLIEQLSDLTPEETKEVFTTKNSAWSPEIYFASRD